ncbi:spermidine synthase [Flexivirga endophytica]|uniref:Spermidine synthase n=1 Tax=Flexivirga endophytica TaxID=1849103 RepID=A0A916SZ64_9MICO|nr:hypothetical protein [Flexivirga endophytica]GGB20289.1 spermidine synthase [Flexivirga endophytica]GHB71175.1 spermidine synthase [Flexivirga endophytica]
MHNTPVNYEIGTVAEVRRAVTTRGEVVLRRRPAAVDDAILELRVNGVFVMDDRHTDTEWALATEALALATEPRRVLVGGLGLGFTARALLADPRVQLVDVAEIEEALIDWTCDGIVPDHGMLSDDRLRIAHADIADAIRDVPAASYDLVLLDVDNGPGYLVYDENAPIYRAPFLRRLRDVLVPDGVVVVWSASASADLHAAMAATFHSAEERAIDVRLGERAEQYFLYVGQSTTVANASSL